MWVGSRYDVLSGSARRADVPLAALAFVASPEVPNMGKGLSLSLCETNKKRLRESLGADFTEVRLDGVIVRVFSAS